MQTLSYYVQADSAEIWWEKTAQTAADQTYLIYLDDCQIAVSHKSHYTLRHCSRKQNTLSPSFYLTVTSLGPAASAQGSANIA